MENYSDNSLPFPFKSAESNSLIDYKRFQTAKTYIKQNSDKIPDRIKQTISSLELMEACGYRNYQKFRDHRKSWDNLERDISLSYLKAIGVDLEQLNIAVTFDRHYYQQALRVPRCPKNAIIRYMACVYGNHNFQYNTSEEEAIKILQEKYVNKGRRCCINYPDIKSIWLEPNENVFTTYYSPDIRITKSWVIVTASGHDIGTVRIG